jgi:hypothetical protein
LEWRLSFRKPGLILQSPQRVKIDNPVREQPLLILEPANCLFGLLIQYSRLVGSKQTKLAQDLLCFFDPGDIARSGGSTFVTLILYGICV